MASWREDSAFSTAQKASLLNPAAFSKFWNSVVPRRFQTVIGLPENKHVRPLTFPPKTGTFRAAKLPTVVPCGGVSLDESGFRTRIPVRVGGFWGLSSGVSTPFRRTSREFGSKNSEWLKCSFRAEPESASDFSFFASQLCLGLRGPSVRLGAVALENYV